MTNRKHDILVALACVKRKGIAALCKYLENESDFFTAPSSTMFHCAYEGGLAEHSWNVYDLLVKKNDQYNTMYALETLILCGLLHDLCKVNMYVIKAEDPTQPQMDYLMKLCKGKLPSVSGKLHKDYVSKLINFYKNGGEMPEYTTGGYVVEDQLPLGHGEKSVMIASKFIQLTDEEQLAIRWHMASFDAGIHFNFPSGFAFRKATEMSRLVTMLFTADAEASNILEATQP